MTLYRSVALPRSCILRQTGPTTHDWRAVKQWRVVTCMPTFVHLTSAKSLARIRRSGVRQSAPGVFCLPVTPNYGVSHQWVRELRRRGQRLLVAVYFWLPDDEPVSIGRYNEQHTATTAAEAAALLMATPDPLGYEVIVARSIQKAELRAIRRVSQVMGWRCMPQSNRRKPCLCDWCTRGEINGQRRRKRASIKSGATAPIRPR